MPRARSPNRDKAKELWIASGKKRLLKDIAAELGVSEGKVRKWKCEDKWDVESANGAKRNSSKGNVPKRKRGGQPGNKNAVGNNGGAPDGNSNAFKHGAYSSIETIRKFIDDDAIAALDGDVLVEEALVEEVNLLSAREIMVMKSIYSLKTGKDGLNNTNGLAISEVVSTQTTRDFGKDSRKAAEWRSLYNQMIEDKISKGERLPGNAVEVTTKTESVFERIQTLEKSLTEIQKQKSRVLDSLARLQAEQEKSTSKTSEAVDDWVSAVMEAVGGSTNNE